MFYYLTLESFFFFFLKRMAEQEGQTKESNKQLAMEQKVLLQDLFRAKNRPDPFSPQNSEIYVIAKEVIDK